MFSVRNNIMIFGQRSKMTGTPKTTTWLYTFDCEFWAFISPFIVIFLKTTLYDRASIFNLKLKFQYPRKILAISSVPIQLNFWRVRRIFEWTGDEYDYLTVFKTRNDIIKWS